ncbi:putative ABC-transporter membrane-spanning ATP-binding component [Trichinella spiralis]|uniref:putative ABC-transporter membrane-spanning ATP-binding component n=1 Tax=Trichinella spiralis TaxID=6334 RepID=UPI0001EFE8E5|nr:putative ABC-transporter membrane-spanning ATP-binding component [Trichinella spiralis]
MLSGQLNTDSKRRRPFVFSSKFLKLLNIIFPRQLSNGRPLTNGLLAACIRYWSRCQLGRGVQLGVSRLLFREKRLLPFDVAAIDKKSITEQEVNENLRDKRRA